MLARISPSRPLMLKGVDFSRISVWLSNSLSRVSRSRTDDEITLDGEGLRDWGCDLTDSAQMDNTAQARRK